MAATITPIITIVSTFANTTRTPTTATNAPIIITTTTHDTTPTHYHYFTTTIQTHTLGSKPHLWLQATYHFSAWQTWALQTPHVHGFQHVSHHAPLKDLTLLAYPCIPYHGYHHLPTTHSMHEITTTPTVPLVFTDPTVATTAANEYNMLECDGSCYPH